MKYNQKVTVAEPVVARAMNKEEPTLLSHFQDIRGELSREGGISIVIYCGKVKSEGDLSAGMALHRGIVEDEVNKEEVNVTGILIGQVCCSNSVF